MCSGFAPSMQVVSGKHGPFKLSRLFFLTDSTLAQSSAWLQLPADGLASEIGAVLHLLLKILLKIL